MSRPEDFHIDVNKEFPHLPHAPIVEAVIQWQASPAKSLDRDELKQQLTTRFPGYSLRTQQQVEAALSASPEAMETHHRTSWGGFRLTSSDEKYICQVKANAVVVSRLAPYENWSIFVADALRFWDSFLELAAPVSVERMGVRFINQIQLKSGMKVSDLVNEKLDIVDSIGLPSNTFFRHDILEVPDSVYRVNLVRAIQEQQPPMVPQRSLIVDIDVSTTAETKADKGAIGQRLSEMRFLKNFVFFKFIKDAESRFGDQTQ